MLGSDEEEESDDSDTEDENKKAIDQVSQNFIQNELQSLSQKVDPNKTEILNDEDKAQEFELSEEKVQKIKTAMSKLNLTPPPWAVAIPEEKWLNKLLYGKQK